MLVCRCGAGRKVVQSVGPGDGLQFDVIRRVPGQASGRLRCVRSGRLDGWGARSERSERSAGPRPGGRPARRSRALESVRKVLTEWTQCR